MAVCKQCAVGSSPAQTASLAMARYRDCKTQNLVYLMWCQACGMQCVGETGNAMHTRMNSHHSDIRTKMLNKQVAPHFSIEGLEVWEQRNTPGQ